MTLSSREAEETAAVLRLLVRGHVLYAYTCRPSVTHPAAWSPNISASPSKGRFDLALDHSLKDMHWRVRFLLHLARTLILPPLTVLAVVWRFHLNFSVAQLVLASLSAIVLTVQLRARWTRYSDQLKAYNLNSRTIPIARGKWPGNLDLLLRLMQTPRKAYVGERIYELFEEYKTDTINLRPLGMDLIITRDNAIVKEILATNFAGWHKGWKSRERLFDFFGRGIFAVDADEWRAHRAMTKPYLSKERTADVDTFWRYGKQTVQLLGEIAKLDVPVLDVQDLVSRFTMDTIFQVMLGECSGTLRGHLPRAGHAQLGAMGSAHEASTGDPFDAFITAFGRAQLLVAQRTVRGQLWPLWELFDNKMAKEMRIVNAFLDPLVEAAQKKKALDSEDLERLEFREQSLLDELVRSIDDPVVVRDELFNIILAGRDSMGSLLTFTIYLLSRHPEVEAKLRTEILEVCGDTEAPPTYTMLKKLKYMRAILNETLRLFPPVPLNHRTSVHDCTVPVMNGGLDVDNRPFFVPAGTQISYSSLLIQRSETLWGPTAEEFRPERWLDPKEAARYHTNFQFIPFNAGPRICLGLNLAYNQVSFLLALIVPRFKFHLAPEYQPLGSAPLPEWQEEIPNVKQMKRVKEERIWPLSSITLYSKGGLWMRVESLED